MGKPLLPSDRSSGLWQIGSDVRRDRAPSIVAALHFRARQIGKGGEGAGHFGICPTQARDIVAVGVSQGVLPTLPTLDDSARIQPELSGKVSRGVDVRRLSRPSWKFAVAVR